MKVYNEISLENFEWYGGAEYTAEKISEAGKWNQLEAILTDQYPDGIDENELNDILRYEEEEVFKWLGIEEEEEEEEADTFLDFCGKFRTCMSCPLFGEEDCTETFKRRYIEK